MHTQEFGRFRSLIWPIHSHELKRVLPMLLMFFCISFIYTILRDTKEALVITAPGSSGQTIHFVKLAVMLPAMIIFVIIYAKLSNRLSKQALFYATILPFLTFFALFAYVLYPARDTLHPTELAEKLQTLMPDSLYGLVPLFRHWTFALFYVFAELWGSVMLSLVFWSFANEITRSEEATRFYSLLGIGASCAMLAAGPVIVWLSDIQHMVMPGVDAWGISIKYLMSIVVIAGLLAVASYWWINRYVEGIAVKTDKPKLSLKESFNFIIRSKNIRAIAILVIAYSLSTNLIEMFWKNQLRLQYPTGNAYNTFMGQFSFYTGVVTLLISLFLGSNIIRRFGTGLGAQITPILILLSGLAFITIVFFKNSLGLFFGVSPLLFISLFGALQNLMSKSCKFAFFDPTKEMIFIPLDQESKVKGKAVVDVLGARVGHSGGSFILQGLFVTFGSSLDAITPYVGIALLLIAGIWIMTIRSLTKDERAPKRDQELLPINS